MVKDNDAGNSAIGRVLRLCKNAELRKGSDYERTF
jgi:hypothetical protein